MRFSTPRRLLNKANHRIRKALHVRWDGTFPEDVVESIFCALLDLRSDPSNRDWTQAALFHACCASKIWHEVGMKYLYADVSLSSEKTLRQFVSNLGKQERLRNYVHAFTFAFPAFISRTDKLHNPDDPFADETKVYELCPNLKFIHREAPNKTPTAREIELDFGAEHLTHLELYGPDHLFTDGWKVSPSDVEFPMLQSLTVGFTTVFAVEDKLRWFRMPQLRRLALNKFQLDGTEPFEFPEHSPLIDTVDVLNCGYSVFRDFFNPSVSPLLPYRNTLRRLTIIGNYSGRFTHWSFDFLTKLESFCLPFKFFCSEPEIRKYPPNLTELTVIGATRSYEESWEEKFDGSFAIHHVICNGEWEFSKVKRVHARVPGIEQFLRKESWKDGRVQLELGVQDNEFAEIDRLLRLRALALRI